MLDVRRLRLLRELHHRGTLAAVADALAYTPSAISQQLALLEREAGVALLERVGRGVRLTEAAIGLVEHTEAVLARLEQAEAELAGASGGPRGRLRIAAFQSAIWALVAPSLGPLGERHPDLRCELVEWESDDVFALVRSGDVDVAVAEEYDHAPRRRDPTTERRELCLDPILVALPARHPLARAGGPVPLGALAQERWATAMADTAFGDMLARICRAEGGFEPDVRHRANDIRTLAQLVRLGDAVALLPGLGRGDAGEGVALRELEAPLSRRLFAAFRAGGGRRPALVAVLEALEARAEALGLRRPAA